MNETDVKKKQFIICHVCPHRCHLTEGKTGRCGVRGARNGKSVSFYPHMVSAIQVDPMEKKPLYHFMPGEKILSIGTFGCTMNCGFCQNYHLLDTGYILQGEKREPEELVSLCINKGLHAIAFTYNEPFVNYEFVKETFIQAKGKEIQTVLVTNGNVMLPVVKEVLPFVDAMNIDLKAFSEQFYHKQSGDLETVKTTIQYAVESGTHVEISFLVIPGENDDMGEFRYMLEWMREIDSDMVLHINRYHPARNYQIPPTPLETLYKMKELADTYLSYVYLGNLPNGSMK